MLNKEEIQRRFEELMRKDTYILAINEEPLLGEQTPYPLGFVLNNEYKLLRVFTESILTSKVLTIEVKGSDNILFSVSVMIDSPMDEVLDSLFRHLGQSLLLIADQGTNVVHTFFAPSPEALF